MATNEKYKPGVDLSWTCTHPTLPVSGGPVRIGRVCGVALTAERADGTTSVAIEGVFTLNVDDDLGTGIVPGDLLYYHDTQTGSPLTSVNNNATGLNALFGIARGTLGANATGSIEVLLGHAVLS